MLRFIPGFCALLMAAQPMQSSPVLAEDSAIAEAAIFLTVRARPGRRDDLLALWEAHLKARAAANDAQTHYVIARDTTDPDVIRITEVYATQAAFQANAQTEWFAAYMERAAPLLAGEPEFAMGAPFWVK